MSDSRDSTFSKMPWAKIRAVPPGLKCDSLKVGLEVRIAKKGDDHSDIVTRGLDVRNFPNNCLEFKEEETEG